MAGSLTNSGVTNAGVTMPSWYGDLSLNAANDVNQQLSNTQQLNSNWYSQPINAGFTSQQTGALTAAGTGGNSQWQPQFNNAAGALSQYQTQYDPSQTQQFMDPYTNSAINSVYNLGNQNLEENLLPQVNSTFTGAGQFGSTRNADFENRAIRDTQQAESNTAGTLLNNQFNNAMTQQYQWNQNPLTAATADQAQGTGALTNFWNNTNNQYNMGANAQSINQTQLGNNYQNWLNSIQIPQSMTGALTSMLPNISTLYSQVPASGASSVLPQYASGLNGLTAAGMATTGVTGLL